MRKLTAVIVITLTTIFLFECAYRLILRFAPDLLTAKAVGLDYGDTWRAEGFGPGGFLKPNFDANVVGPYRNLVHWKTNAQGFRNDYDVSPTPEPGVIRVMSIGDSFTAGYRLAQDETFSHLFERFLNAKGDGHKYEVLISVANDPAEGLDYFNQLGYTFKPKLVILGLTLGNDIPQSYVGVGPGGKFTLTDDSNQLLRNPSQTLGFNHGLEMKLIPERCIDKSKSSFLDHFVTYRLARQFLRARNGGDSIASWYDKQYPKLFDPVNGLGGYLREPPAETRESYEQFFRTIRAWKNTVEKNGGRLALVIFPQRFQVKKEDWQNTVAEYRLDENCFDLDLPNRLIVNFCNQNDILCIDPTAAMKAAQTDAQKSLYCPQGDMHPNAEGNRILFETIKDTLYRELSSLQ